MTDEYRDPIEETEEKTAPETEPEKVSPAPEAEPTREASAPETKEVSDPAAETPRAPHAPQVPPPPRSSFYNGANGEVPPRNVPPQAWTPQPNMPQPNAPQGGWNYQPQPPKKKKTGAVVGIVVAAVAYLVLLGVLLASMGNRGQSAYQGEKDQGQEENIVSSEEPKSDNAPIVTEQGQNGSGSIVSPDYTGETLTPAELYKQNVESVVYVESHFTNGKGMGSGFVIDDENGYILTNHHVWTVPRTFPSPCPTGRVIPPRSSAGMRSMISPS